MSSAAAACIGRGILGRLPAELESRGLGGRILVITDSAVGPRYLPAVTKILMESGLRVAATQIPAGEPSKSLERAKELYNWLLEQGAERDDTILALGGGVVGDLAGFVAATFLRGLRWAQVATTLLAQVDSSIGGKVAVDLPGGKNMVGAFHPAALALLDTELLDSLPPRHLLAGWAEAVKTAMMFDRELFETFEERLNDPRDPELLLLAVERCVRHKARVVDADPLDRGVRALLNYGHTLGHAIEAATGYSAYLHGEAVAVGMAGAAAIALKMGMIDGSVEERQNALLRRLGLPLKFSGASADQVEALIRRDKKSRDGRPRWVLAEGIGRGTFGNLAPAELEREAIARLASG